MRSKQRRQQMLAVLGVLALNVFSATSALATCSSIAYGGAATVTCNQTSDFLIVSQSSGYWKHLGALIGESPFDWDSSMAGEQSIPAGGTLEIGFSSGGGQLNVGDAVTPPDALVGTVFVGNPVIAGTIVLLDGWNSASAHTYTIDDGPGVTTVGQLNVYDSASAGLQLIVSTGSAVDTIDILSVYRNDTVVVQTSGGADQINIGKAGSVQSIAGQVAIFNAFAGSGIAIDDHVDASARIATVALNGVTGIAPAPIMWNPGAPGAIVLNMGTGDDIVNVLSLPNPHGATSLSIVGSAGEDQVFIGNAGSVQAIAAPVGVAAPGGHIHLSIADSADVVTRYPSYSSNGITGLAPAPITWSGDGVIEIWTWLGGGDNVVHVLGAPPNTSSMFVFGDGKDECYVNGAGLQPGSSTTIGGGNGDDVFVVSAVPMNVQALTIYGGSQTTADRLVYTSGPASGAFPGNGTLVPDDPTKHPIDYQSVEQFSINDVIFISGFE